MAIAGGSLFEPMATLMIGELIVASTLTLFFVPAAYYLMFKNARIRNAQAANANNNV